MRNDTIASISNLETFTGQFGFKESLTLAAGGCWKRDLRVAGNVEEQAGGGIAEAFAEVIAEAAGIGLDVDGVEGLLAPVGGPAHFTLDGAGEFLLDEEGVGSSDGGCFPPDEVEDFMGEDAIEFWMMTEKRAVEDDEAAKEEGGGVHVIAAGVGADELATGRAEVRAEFDEDGLAGEFDGRFSQFEGRRCGRR